MNADTTPWWAKWVLGYTFVVALIGVAGVIIWRSPDASQYAQIVVTAMITLGGAVVGYYFGSSSGSDKKDSTIASTSAALATSTPGGDTSDAAKQLAAKLQ